MDDQLAGNMHDFLPDNQIKCIKCGTEQALSNKCKKCGEEMWKWCCAKCGFSSLNVPFFHCDQCNHCVEGRKEDFYHCDKCVQCVRIDNKPTHAAVCKPQGEDCCQICMAKYD